MTRATVRNISQIKKSTLIKDYIEGALRVYREANQGKGIGWKETCVHTTKPTLEWPYTSTITLYGHNRFVAACAIYEGPYGRWKVSLKSHNALKLSWTDQDKMTDECFQTLGTPVCLEASDLWRESQEQRRQRARDLAAQGIV